MAESTPEQKDEPGTALLPPEAERALSGLRVHQAVTAAAARIHAEIAAKSWGKDIPVEMRMQLALYCERYQLDVSHVEVLGGKLYRTADFYHDRLSQMIEDGLVEGYKVDHVAIDARLTLRLDRDEPEVRQAAQLEIDRREDQRIAQGIPDAAVAAVVFSVKFKRLMWPVSGANWCGGDTAVKIGRGGALKRGKDADPIGEAFPHKTAETRAARRCLRRCVPLLTPAQRKKMEAADADWNRLEVGQFEVIEGAPDNPEDERGRVPAGMDQVRTFPTETMALPAPAPGNVRVHASQPPTPSVLAPDGKKVDPYTRGELTEPEALAHSVSPAVISKLDPERCGVCGSLETCEHSTPGTVTPEPHPGEPREGPEPYPSGTPYDARGTNPLDAKDPYDDQRPHDTAWPTDEAQEEIPLGEEESPPHFRTCNECGGNVVSVSEGGELLRGDPRYTCTCDASSG